MLICLHVHENEIRLTSKFVPICMLLHVLSVLIQCFSGLAPMHSRMLLTLICKFPSKNLLIQEMCYVCGGAGLCKKRIVA